MPPGGAADTLPVDLGAELIAVTRESLSNVAKHARSTCTSIRVEVDDRSVTVAIDDDGVGFTPDAASAGSGVKNLHERAHRLGGEAIIGQRTPHGTAIRWTVPRHKAR